jgi:hypothetical protein
MIRSGFSLLLVRSAKYGTTLRLTNALQKLLVAWADTTPGVTGYSVATHAFEFAVGNKTKTATVPLVIDVDGRQQYWDTTPHGSAGKPSTTNEVIRAHAELGACGYELFDTDRFNQNIIEKKNRQSAQNLLYLAHDWDTVELETECLMALVAGALTVAQLAKKLVRTETQMMVIALRLWLRKRVVLPLATDYLQPSWTVRRAEYVYA